jgi:hypothetical protein
MVKTIPTAKFQLSIKEKEINAGAETGEESGVVIRLTA